jgi:outer membrane PBP1 activator LpoA protein
MVAALACALAAAFCAVPASAATEPVRSLQPQVPDPSLLSPSIADPAAKPPGDATPAPEPPLSPKDRKADVVLVLPLKSTDYVRAAEAVRDGFLAAAGSDRTQRVAVIAHGDGEVVDAFDTARATGAPVVVGPLVRDHLRTLAASGAPLPVTIALNQLDDGAALPERIYTLALAIESDARLLARKAREDGVASIAVIGGDSPLMRRFAVAFTGEWILAGGGAPRSFPFEPTPDGLSVLRRELGRAAADGALIAVDGADAGLARSFAPRLPAYASALVNQGAAGPELRDMEGVQFVDVPWVVAPDDPALASLPRRDLGSPALERLYALGLDSFRVARAFVDGVPRRLDFEGATGHITLGDRRVLAREGRLAVIRGGRVVAQSLAR